MYPTFNSVSSYVDLVLSNKLVVYDLDNEVIGWVDHNCKYLTHSEQARQIKETNMFFFWLGSTSIKVKDGSGASYSVEADNLIASSSSVINGTLATLLSILIWVFLSFTSQFC